MDMLISKKNIDRWGYEMKKIFLIIGLTLFVAIGSLVTIAEMTPYQKPPYDDEYTYQNILGFTIVRDYANNNKIVDISF